MSCFVNLANFSFHIYAVDLILITVCFWSLLIDDIFKLYLVLVKIFCRTCKGGHDNYGPKLVSHHSTLNFANNGHGQIAGHNEKLHSIRLIALNIDT